MNRSIASSSQKPETWDSRCISLPHLCTLSYPEYGVYVPRTPKLTTGIEVRDENYKFLTLCLLLKIASFYLCTFADENRYSVSKGAPKNLKHVERTPMTVNKTPGEHILGSWVAFVWMMKISNHMLHFPIICSEVARTSDPHIEAPLTTQTIHTSESTKVVIQNCNIGFLVSNAI